MAQKTYSQKAPRLKYCQSNDVHPNKHSSSKNPVTPERNI